MNNKNDSDGKHRILHKHELFTLVAVFIVGILVGNFVIAGPRPQAQCNDGVDNDGDTKTDYPNDPGCSSKRDTTERGSITCDDGVDNDGDTKTDYPNDPGCSSPSDTSELSTIQCDDGVDNGDADSLKDFPSDLGCVSPSDANEVDGQCDDLSDNDNDTTTDYPNDSGCTSFSDASELGSAQCDDGVDNDGNGKVDYPDDLGCSNPSDTSEATLIPDSCSDTDGGFSIYLSGLVSGSSNQQSYSFSDYCLNSNTLVEHYCSGTIAISSNFNCQGVNNSTNSSLSCVNGACI